MLIVTKKPSLLTKLRELKTLASIDFSKFTNWKKIKFGNQEVTAHDLVGRREFTSRIIVLPPKTKLPESMQNNIARCLVIVGVIRDKRNDFKTFKMNEEVNYNKGEVHTPYNPSKKEYAVILIDFYK